MVWIDNKEMDLIDIFPKNISVITQLEGLNTIMTLDFTVNIPEYNCIVFWWHSAMVALVSFPYLYNGTKAKLSQAFKTALSSVCAQMGLNQWMAWVN